MEAEREQEVRRIAETIDEDFRPYLPQLEESLERVYQLVALAGLVTGLANISRDEIDPAATPIPADDALRAAVVLIHACFEDFLRTLTNKLLPEADSIALKDITLAGVDPRKTQFHVGHLIQHRNKTVDELIRESVSLHLERSTFNNTDAVAELLQRLHLEVDPARKYFPVLDEMMRRRHQIVHRADRVKDPVSATFKLAAISAEQVLAWRDATRDFVVNVVSRIAAGSVIGLMNAKPKRPGFED